MTMDLTPIEDLMEASIKELEGMLKPASPSPDLLVCRSDGGRSLIFLSAYSAEGQAFLNTRIKAMLRDHPAEMWAVIEVSKVGLVKVLQQAITENLNVKVEEDSI
jgi:hypothetical protein